MKKIISFGFTTVIVLFFIACDNTSLQYKEKLEREKEAIANYLKRNNITVITGRDTVKPEFKEFREIVEKGRVYPENTFFLTNSGVYFRLDDAGNIEDDTVTVKTGLLVLFRYYKMTLDENPDTVTRQWTSVDYGHNSPRFMYGQNPPNHAFQEAVALMKRTETQAQLIVPSAVGFSTDFGNVIPYLFTLRIRLAD